MKLRSFMYAGALILLCLAWPIPGTGSAVPNSVEDASIAELNGYVWESSSPQARLDFLLGVECALAIEAALDEAAAERGEPKRASPFIAGWQKTFQNVTRSEIAESINEFYSLYPDQKGRHVFDVIWTEMIKPTMAKEEIS